MMIKVCGITRREDARAAEEAGASALGFIFYRPSPRYITPEQAAGIGDGLAVLKVGIFVDEAPAAIESAMRTANLDIAQIYGGATPAGGRGREGLLVGGWGRCPFSQHLTPPLP